MLNCLLPVPNLDPSPKFISVNFSKFFVVTLAFKNEKKYIRFVSVVLTIPQRLRSYWASLFASFSLLLGRAGVLGELSRVRTKHWIRLCAKVSWQNLLKMKIVILGATGNTGKPLLRQTLEKGHTVTAILRDPSKLTTENSNLTTIKVSCNLHVFTQSVCSKNLAKKLKR